MVEKSDAYLKFVKFRNISTIEINEFDMCALYCNSNSELLCLVKTEAKNWSIKFECTSVPCQLKREFKIAQTHTSTHLKALPRQSIVFWFSFEQYIDTMCGTVQRAGDKVE